MVNRYRRANHVAALLWINLIFVLFLFDSLSFQCLCPESKVEEAPLEVEEAAPKGTSRS
jgi:hypothetical protein